MAGTLGGGMGSLVKAAVKAAGAWLFLLATRKGRGRWILLAVSAVALLTIGKSLFSGNDQNDPSFFVPRSAAWYLEAVNVDALLEQAGAWPLWTAEQRRRTQTLGTEQWGHLEVALGEFIGLMAEGLGSRSPVLWLNSASGAAVAAVEGENPDTESWALYLNIPSPAKALAEIRVESNLDFTRIDDRAYRDVYELKMGEGRPSMFFAAVSTWFIVSTGSALPKFAVDSLKISTRSLAASGLLPAWKRGASLRGMYNPSRIAAKSAGSPLLSLFGSWMDTDARISYLARLNDYDDIAVEMSVGSLRNAGGGSILWVLFKFIAALIGLLALALILVVFLNCAGLAGWLKLRASRLGIVPAAEPAAVEPSLAFREDAGMEVKATEVEAAVESVESVPPVSSTETAEQAADDSASATVEEGGDSGGPAEASPAAAAPLNASADEVDRL